MEAKIDIHKTDKAYELALSKFERDEYIDRRNKELILNFLWDCKIGKTLKGRAKKKLGKRRMLKYLYLMKRLEKWVGKPFDEVSLPEMERLVSNIEENFYKNREKDYSEGTKLDFKKALRKFYKWLGLPNMVEFIDMTDDPKDVPAITREEAEKLINSTHEIGVKAVLIVLFDGGPRAEELLNIRLKDITKKSSTNDGGCYWINVRYSKTFGRTIPLPISTSYLNDWLAEHPLKHNPETQLFPFTYPVLRKKIRVLSEKVLKKNLTLHMLRHSSATYWAPKMNRYQLCAKYGWSFNSDMPDRYIKRKGIIFEEIAEKGDVDQNTKLQKENRELQEKMEGIENEYKKVRKALEFIMPAIMGKMDSVEFKRKVFEKRRHELALEHEVTL